MNIADQNILINCSQHIGTRLGLITDELPIGRELYRQTTSSTLPCCSLKAMTAQITILSFITEDELQLSSLQTASVKLIFQTYQKLFKIHQKLPVIYEFNF